MTRGVERTPRLRVYEVAGLLGVENKALLAALGEGYKTLSLVELDVARAALDLPQQRTATDDVLEQLDAAAAAHDAATGVDWGALAQEFLPLYTAAARGDENSTVTALQRQFLDKIMDRALREKREASAAGDVGLGLGVVILPTLYSEQEPGIRVCPACLKALNLEDDQP